MNKKLPQHVHAQYTFIADLELCVEFLDVFLHSLYQLVLILTDSSSDVGTHKQRVVAGEDTKHLISIPGRAQLVSKTSSNPCLNTINSLLISE